MSARTGARTGLSPPALASDSSALDHSATEGTIKRSHDIQSRRFSCQAARPGTFVFCVLTTLCGELVRSLSSAKRFSEVIYIIIISIKIPMFKVNVSI